MDVKICSKCNKLMCFNSYFHKYYCDNCGHMEEKMKFNTAAEKYLFLALKDIAINKAKHSPKRTV